MINNQAFLTGILAGIAAGLMVLAAFNAGMLAFLLFFAAPAAIYIATMGWGSAAGIIAVLVGGGLATWFGSSAFGGLAGLLLFAPAAYVGHLVNLGAPQASAAANDNHGGIVWFPLGQILLRLMAILAAGFLLIGFASGVTNEMLVTSFSELLKQVYSANPDLPVLDDARITAQAVYYAKLVPIILPALWLIMHVITAFVAAKITRRSGLLARGNEDIAATVTLPAEAAIFLALGLIGEVVLPGALALASGVLMGIGIGGFGLIGLAQLHLKTRGNPGRGVILGVAYGSIVLLSIPYLIFTAIGLYRSFKTSGRTSSGPSNPA